MAMVVGPLKGGRKWKRERESEQIRKQVLRKLKWKFFFTHFFSHGSECQRIIFNYTRQMSIERRRGCSKKRRNLKSFIRHLYSFLFLFFPTTHFLITKKHYTLLNVHLLFCNFFNAQKGFLLSLNFRAKLIHSAKYPLANKKLFKSEF